MLMRLCRLQYIMFYCEGQIISWNDPQSKPTAFRVPTAPRYSPPIFIRNHHALGSSQATRELDIEATVLIDTATGEQLGDNSYPGICEP